MNPSTIILTSVVVSAVVASLFNLFGQWAERKARQRELLFTKSVELAMSNREFITMLADKKPERNVTVYDYTAYVEMYYVLLKDLQKKGHLPHNWEDPGVLLWRAEERSRAHSAEIAVEPDSGPQPSAAEGIKPSTDKSE